MLQRYVKLENSDLERQAIDFIHGALMIFLRQITVTGLVRKEPYKIKELKKLLGKQKVIEIDNMIANYETLKEFIRNSKIHVLEEQLEYNENEEIRKYTIVNLEITVIFEVKKVTWDRYPEIRFAECNMKIINKPYEQVKLEEGLQSLIEMKKAELGRITNLEEIFQLLNEIELIEKIVQPEKVFDTMSFLKVNHI